MGKDSAYSVTKAQFNLQLSDTNKKDLIEYLKGMTVACQAETRGRIEVR